MAHRADLDALLGPAVIAAGSELLGCEFLSQGKHSLLRVYIDRPAGVTADDCEAVSRQVSALLDVEDPIATEYTLEVSSPGLDRPLFTAAHYLQAKGALVKVSMHTPIAGQRNFNGHIVDVIEQHVLIEENGKQVQLPLADVVKANLVYQLDLKTKATSAEDGENSLKMKGKKNGQ